MAKDKELETTFYRFYSEIRSFLSKLISDPIKAKPSKYLTDREFGRTKLINVLMDKKILERHESIKDQTNSDAKKPTYCVRYKVRKKDFEQRIHRIYSKYFEKNLPEKKKEEELDECSSCGSVGGGPSGNASGSYSTPLFGKPISQGHLYENDEVNVKSVFANEDKEIEKLKKIEPAYVTRGGLKESPRRVILTQEQINYIQENINAVNAADVELEEATGMCNIGAVGDYTANGLVLKTSDGKKDPCYDR